GFKIEESTDGTTFTPVGTASPNAMSYSVTGLSPSTAYSFRVSASNAAGASAPTNTAAATTPSAGSPAAPNNLAAMAVSASRIDLSWADNSTDEDGFKLYRSTDGVSWVWFATASANVTAFTWWGASAGSTYSFRITAYNAG